MQLALLFFVQVYTLFQLYLISINRKIGWRVAWLYLWVGAFSVIAVTLIVHIVTTRIIPPEINSYTLNPLVEETLTILPVVLLACANPLGESLDVLDWMLLGTALGLGFGFMETGIRIVGYPQEWHLHQASWSHLGSLVLTWLPERLREGLTGYAGHGIAGALTGFGVGLWRKNRRFGGMAFLIFLGWAIFDHSLTNYTIDSWFWEKKWAKFFWNVTGRGQFMPWALGIFILFDLLYDLRVHGMKLKNKISSRINYLADFISAIFSKSFWIKIILSPRQKWLQSSSLKRIVLLLQIYFWLSLFLVFFFNGWIPHAFYHWYFQTPLWWLAGMIGAGFAIEALWRFMSEWHHEVTFEEANAQLIFWGRGFLCIGAIIFLLGGVANFILTLNHHSLSDFFRIHFLYYAFNAFLDFIKEGLSSALAVFAGLGGLISTAHAETPGGRREEYEEYTKIGGSRSWRNNNPGNIEYGPFAQRHGAVGPSSSGRFAKFPTEEVGFNALKDLLNTDRYKGMTLKAAIKAYAPPEDHNDPEQYVKILNGLGFDPDRKVGDQLLEELAQGIKKVEGWQEGTIIKK